MINQIVGLLRDWGRLTRAVEGLLIDNIAATSPWLAPLVPAYMVWEAMVTHLAFPRWVALATAGVVELLGLSAVATVFQFWDYNDARRKKDQNAPVIPAILTAVFYLGVVLTVNIMLDDAGMMHKTAKALLSTLSVCAAVILALRSQHSRRIQGIEEERQERREMRRESFRKVSGKFPEVSGGRNDWRLLPEEDKEQVREMSTREIVVTHGVDERTARNWKQYAERGNGRH